MAGEIYIGLMTGTSADSLDCAAVTFSDNELNIIGLKNYDIPSNIKEEISENTRSKKLNETLIKDLDLRLGEFFSEKIEEFIASLSLKKEKIEAIGSHGQTIKHEPNSIPPFSLQIGNPQLISNKLGIKTIANFRDDDIAKGGQGAPLSPIFHKEVFAKENKKRVIINIGGITNISSLGGAKLIGFDTGPGNCLLDIWTKKNKKGNYDNEGNWAKAGTVDQDLLDIMMKDNYFSLEPPKSTGPDYFNLSWLQDCLMKLKREIDPRDTQATLVELTASSLSNSLKRLKIVNENIYICGGGVHNKFLMRRISFLLGEKCYTTDKLGLDPDYIEAICFAWLAYKRVNNIKFNMSAITGSNEKVFLGKVYLPTK